MLYELIAICRPGKLNEVREIAKSAGLVVLSRQGVVRGLTNWGTFLLPKPLRIHTVLHNTGHYFIMRFDSSAKTQHVLKRTLSLDPRLIRYSVVKMGTTLEHIKDIPGRADWNGETSGAGRVRETF